MKIELGKRAKVILFILFVINAQTMIYAGGIKDMNNSTQPSEETKIFLYSIPVERPDWVDKVPQSATEYYFVGTSQHFDNAANARNDAREDARNQVLKFYGEFIERQAIESGSMSGNTRDTLETFVVREDEIRSYAENVISQIGTDRYFTEVYINKNNQEEYIVYTLSQISRKKAEEEITNFAKNISQRYSAMMTTKTSLRSTLEDYITVARALQQNTLHRVTAYHEGTAGRTGLYGHVMSGINELINSITIVEIPNRSIQKPDTLDTIVRFNSSKTTNIGPFDCRVRISGMNINAPTANYTINNDNSFLLQNHTTRLEPGIYTVQIELLLQEVTGNIGRNINRGFTFEVMPLTVILATRTEIETGIKKAVDTLAGRLKNQTETIIGLFALTGTDIPSGLSLFLTERVKHYAVNNPQRRYRINSEIENNQISTLSGFFTKRGNHVDVTLELTTPAGEGDGSQFFSISVDILNELGISIEPENFSFLSDETFIPRENQKIKIQAFFNSESRTYMHRDELGMTVTADRDCYFIVFHIDVNNQKTMIYPNSVDTAAAGKNYLRANTLREIFESKKIYLYEPYGTETIIVAASSEQFKDIEQYYLVPFEPATRGAVRTAVRGSIGEQSEGDAVYSITILKPHEEYEYCKPENMIKMAEMLYSDVIRQGGTFDDRNNDISGVFTVNNIRGSYRLPRNEPDKIQFTFYNLDNFTGGRNAGVTTRGGGVHTFSFARPGNMTQAVQIVKAGIEESGGTFSGNEQRGNFRAKGITGQYSVSDMVSVTITDKPFIIPNSVIEREVKIFFGER